MTNLEGISRLSPLIPRSGGKGESAQILGKGETERRGGKGKQQERMRLVSDRDPIRTGRHIYP